jgi:hypothetical protein
MLPVDSSSCPGLRIFDRRDLAAMMFGRIIGGVRRAAATEVRLIALGGAAGLAAMATLSILCSAPFVFVMDRNGVLDA